jgi:hypothetical protein
MPARRWNRIGVVVAALLAAGCHVPVSELTGTARDEWVRSYTIADGGELQVSSSNGAIVLEGYDGPTVEVRAERSAKAMSEEAARELVSKIVINEDVSPDRVVIRTEGIDGLLVGVSYQVTYHVRAPHTIVARLRVTNGTATARSFNGHLIATSTNGGVVGENLAGRIEARSTNGHVRVAATAVAPGGIRLQTTNGHADLVVPETAKADVTVETRNGTVAVEGLSLEPFGEQSKRVVNGRLGGGGAPIEVRTTNGNVRLGSRAKES